MSQVSIIDIEGNHPQIPTQFDANIGFAIPIGNVLEIVGDFVAAGSTPVYTFGSGNTISTNVQITQAIPVSNVANIGLAAFDSADFNVDSNGFVSLVSPSGIQQISGDTGLVSGPNVTIYANNSGKGAGSTVLFQNSATVSTLRVTDVNANTHIGNLAGNLTESGVYNTSFGYLTLAALTSGQRNTTIGSISGQAITTGNYNLLAGYTAGGALRTGSYNVILGPDSSGTAYNTSESSNVIISNLGVINDSNTIRIGTQGTGNGQQNRNFQAGIFPVTIAASAPVGVDTNGQLSNLGFGSAGEVFTSNGAGISPSWQSAGGGGTNSTFSAYMSADATNVTGDNTGYTIIFDTTIVNQGTVYNIATGEFTAPNTGNYSFSFNMLAQSTSGFNASNWFLYVNGVANNEFFGGSLPSTVNYSSIYASSILVLNAGDVVTVVYSASSISVTPDTSIFGGSTLIRFSGFQIS